MKFSVIVKRNAVLTEGQSKSQDCFIEAGFHYLEPEGSRFEGAALLQK